MAVQKESLGPAFQFDDEYRVYWSYIGHFIHAPFYANCTRRRVPTRSSGKAWEPIRRSDRQNGSRTIPNFDAERL